jgi:hypothetical protein
VVHQLTRSRPPSSALTELRLASDAIVAVIEKSFDGFDGKGNDLVVIPRNFETVMELAEKNGLNPLEAAEL